MRALPPFDGLVAFEATARHGSVTLAAHELRLTQSAISHRLKKLESFVGTALFERTRVGLQPTSAGDALRTDVVRLLDEMAAFRARSRAAAKPAALRVGVGSALSQYWLIRRLPRLAAAYPGAAVEIIEITTEAQGRASDVDIQILWQPKGAAYATSTQRMLFEECVFPVAVPTLLPGGRPLQDFGILRSLPLIHKGATGRHDAAEWSWTSWFTRLGLGPKAPDGLRFDTISLSLAAALDGGGVALGRSLLTHDALAEGRLIRVLTPEWEVPSSKVHVIRWQAALSGDPRVTRFVDWIASEVAAMIPSRG